MNRIHEKRVKRKRKLEGRIECHGNKYPCWTHIKRRPEFKEETKYIPETKEAKSWFKRSKEKIYAYFK